MDGFTRFAFDYIENAEHECGREEQECGKFEKSARVSVSFGRGKLKRQRIIYHTRAFLFTALVLSQNE